MAHVGEEVALHARCVLGPFLGFAQFSLAGLKQGVGLGQIGRSLHHPLFQSVVQSAVGRLGTLALGDVAQDHGQQVFTLDAHARDGRLRWKLLARGAQAVNQGLAAHHPGGLARQCKALHHLQVRGAKALGQQHLEIAAHHVALRIAEHARPGRVDHAYAVGRVHRDDAVHGGIDHGTVASRAGLQFLPGLLNARGHLVEVARQLRHLARALLWHRLADLATRRKLHAGLLQARQRRGHARPHQPGQQQHHHGRQAQLTQQMVQGFVLCGLDLVTQVQIHQDGTVRQVAHPRLGGALVIGHHHTDAPSVSRLYDLPHMARHHALEQGFVEIGDHLGGHLSTPGQTAGQGHRAVGVDHGDQGHVVLRRLDGEVGSQRGGRAERSALGTARHLGRRRQCVMARIRAQGLLGTVDRVERGHHQRRGQHRHQGEGQRHLETEDWLGTHQTGGRKRVSTNCSNDADRSSSLRWTISCCSAWTVPSKRPPGRSISRQAAASGNLRPR